MAFSKWLCTNNTKNQFIKIVHPGGHVELHDRPLLAAEIVHRNPKCCVAYPQVFQQPFAIIAPETSLVLGQKYYVVPISTVRKLQRHSMKYCPSPVPDMAAVDQNGDQEEEASGACGFLSKNSTLCACLKDSGGAAAAGGRAKKRGGRRDGDKHSSDETKSLYSETKKRNISESARRRSPTKHRKSFDYWQPNLESINEAIVDENEKVV